MTEYNLFCYSKNYNDKDSFQQKRYRAFNQEVGKERYEKIREQVRGIIPNPNKLKFNDFWKSITQNQWKQLLSIPEAQDFREGFEYISGVNIDLEPNLIGKTVEVKIDNITYSATINDKKEE